MWETKKKKKKHETQNRKEKKLKLSIYILYVLGRNMHFSYSISISIFGIVFLLLPVATMYVNKIYSLYVMFISAYSVYFFHYYYFSFLSIVLVFVCDFTFWLLWFETNDAWTSVIFSLLNLFIRYIYIQRNSVTLFNSTTIFICFFYSLFALLILEHVKQKRINKSYMPILQSSLQFFCCSKVTAEHCCAMHKIAKSKHC